MTVTIKNTEQNLQQVKKSQEDFSISGKKIEITVSEHFENYFDSGQMTIREYKENVLDLNNTCRP